MFLASTLSTRAFAAPSYAPATHSSRVINPTLPNPQESFLIQTRIIVTTKIASNGQTQKGPLLVVSTTPKGQNRNEQGALWGFRICQGPAEFIFAVSLGAGVNSQSPTIDIKDGVIAVGRLVNSVALIDIKNAMLGCPKQ